MTDENDNSPQFQFPAPYKMSVQEDAPLGTGVGQLVAFDGDDGMNAQFEYSITHANIGEWYFFNILKLSSLSTLTVIGFLSQRSRVKDDISQCRLRDTAGHAEWRREGQ